MNDIFSIAKWEEYTAKNELPFSVLWHITEKCNLRCKHCYLTTKKSTVDKESANKIIDFIKRKNFFKVVLSGGECVLHSEFKDIYLALKFAGMQVDIFSNGTSFKDEDLQLFAKYPPAKIEISVYGTDEESFFEATGDRNGFDKLINNLRFFSEKSIPVTLKAPLTKFNVDRIDEIIDIAKRFSASFKFATYIFAGNDGDLSPLATRLPCEKVVEIEMNDEKSVEEMINKIKKYEEKKPSFKERCRGCSNSFVINADNSFSFCGIQENPKFYFNSTNIENAFEQVVKFRETMKQMYEESPCFGCELAKICNGCPAHLIRENGTHLECNQYMREVAQKKLAIIGQGKNNE